MTKKSYCKPATVTVASAPSVCAADSYPRIVIVDSGEDEADPGEEML